MTMWDIIYKFTTWASRLHDSILGINDAGGWYFDDKQLHFLVFGAIGMLLIFVLYPIFKFLASRNHTMVITWLYVFTVIIVLTFAIEIGQGVLRMGNTEQGDITYGIMGFLFFFAIFAIIRLIVHGIIKLKNKHKAKRYYS